MDKNNFDDNYNLVLVTQLIITTTFAHCFPAILIYLPSVAFLNVLVPRLLLATATIYIGHVELSRLARQLPDVLSRRRERSACLFHCVL